MNQHKNIFVGLILVCLLSTLTTPGLAQSSGTIRGRVTLETSDKPVHNVTVTIIQLKRATETDDSGMYEFKDVPRASTTSSRTSIACPMSFKRSR